MNPELKQWESVAFHDGKFHNSIIALIAEAVWPGTDTLPIIEKRHRHGTVSEVLAGAPVPTLSQKDRDVILAAAKPILEGMK